MSRGPSFGLEKICMAEEADPAAGDAHAVVGTRSVDIVVYLGLLAFALLLGFDNWRTGMAWEADGPQAGYFPFYLSVLLGAASLYGLVYKLIMESGPGDTFVTREQFRRVMQVFVPTLLFCVFMQWLGLYVASFILVTGFMWFVGRIAPWKSLVTGFLFSFIMFITFDIAFDVIMPKGPLEAAFGH
jgi:putative tricarboxylic transport membrane protein